MQAEVADPGAANAALQAGFNFTPADLRANQQGRITERQERRMREQHQDTIRISRGFFIFVMIIGYLGSGLAALTEGLSLIQMWGWISFGFLCLYGFVWTVIFFDRRQLERTLRDGGLAQTRGPLRLVVRQDKTPSYYFYVGAHEFSIDHAAYTRLQRGNLDGQQALVYYTKRWRWVLSAAIEAEA
ncbi:hypothetical protein EYB53_001765 [Candidatus Chloroploca sp. M-50]|uniref:Uncharacterized protein n=1 Tax=Candidatus Chloroploca mongolica TaxID=2528176 RepID=A0ABS4D4S3_9CHLR|nr:hypothetical protein [Candidatus Chloroploca mongolica]MBP1464424.1 hypothetical protein [Candidatus Chloroploca mongolica]